MQQQKRLFLGCIVALVATSFGFIARAIILNDWQIQFNLSETQKGAIQGAGLFPFALSIILFSLIIDKIGCGRTMVFAWLGHVISAIVTINAHSYESLYFGTLIFALANGAVEAVINPVTATIFAKEKTHYLNILHAGWPGGLVVGGILAIIMGSLGVEDWRWKVGLVLIPTALYGVLLAGQKFPMSERVAAGVSYLDMLKEFGWGSCLLAMFFLANGIDQFLSVLNNNQEVLGFWGTAALVAVPTLLFAAKVRTFGRPLFVILLMIMILLATTELGTDSWISDLMTPVLRNVSKYAGNWVLVYTSAIMFVLRFFAGPIVHRISPLGLLAICAGIASLGLLALSSAQGAALIFLAATLYGVGKTFFWPTTLGVVSEQFPRGGALTLNAIAGVGMISVGVLGGPFLGALQDISIDMALQQKGGALHEKVAKPEVSKYGLKYRPLDQDKLKTLSADEAAVVEGVRTETKQSTLTKVAVLPAIMFVCYLMLILGFKARGGYKPVELSSEPAAGHT